MSIIAKSLKKIKNEKDGKIKKSLFDYSNFNYYDAGFFLIILIFIFIIVGFSLDYYIFFKKYGEKSNFNISDYEKKFYTAVSKYKQLEEKRKKEVKLKYLLFMGKYSALNKILNKLKNENYALYLKYSGILLFKLKKFEEAKIIFKQYLKKYGYDDDVLSYLANIYYKQKKYFKAINLYNKINKNIFEVNYNKAVIYERLMNFKKSLYFYKKSYLLARDPLLKKRIFNKIFLLENYE